MKKLLSLLFLFTCIGFTVAQAQGNIVYGQVTDGNGNPITDAVGYIEYTDCNTTESDELYLGDQGFYEYLLLADCTQGAVYVTFTCPNGSTVTGQGSYFPNSPEVEINLTLDCGTVGNEPCTVTYTTGDSLGIPILDAYVQGGVAPYAYEWWVGQEQVSNTQYLDMSNYPDGTYSVCVVVYGADGNACEYCDDIIVDSSNNQCWTSFDQMDNTGAVLGAWTQGTSNSYTYQWTVSTPTTTVTYTGGTVDLSDLGDGTYYVCLTATGADGDECDYCETITINTQASCDVFFFETDSLTTDNQLQAYITGSASSYQYEWSLNGDVVGTGSQIDISDYENGTYYFCLVVYGSDGSVCEYCESVTIGNENGGDECLDWNVIDLANAPCNMDYNPVCGCDGIEYTNACIAYYCFGVLEWTDGPCNYDGEGNNGNTDGNPIGEECETTAEFFYYGDMNPNGGFDVFFFGFGEEVNEFTWSMGDGTDYSGNEANHTYYTNDSLQSYTVCMTAWGATDSCSATICETIVLDDTPNGYIGGEVVEGSGIGGSDGEVERLSGTAGDPMSEVTVELQDPTGAIIATTTTDEQGKYSFSGLQFGDYFVHVNIDGVSHSPDHIKLNPVVQEYDDISYEVTGEEVILGVDGVSFASGIGMSPNPTSNNINISLTLHESADINIVITDILGKTVRQMNNHYNQGSQSIELDLEDLSSGIYMVSLRSNGEVYTQKILKK